MHKYENIIVLSQCDFHLDFSLRPLNYPYVLVNDDEETDKKLAKMREKFKRSVFINDISLKIEKRKKEYAPSEKLCKVLEEHGFIPIKIAGFTEKGSINFINAIVH